MKRGIIIGGLLLIFLIGSGAIYLTFFYKEGCDDKSCYETALRECKRAKYIDDARDAAWEFEILGRSGGECFVNSRLLILKEGDLDMKKLEGEEMICSIPLGSVDNPTSNLDNCHGVLKEYIQEAMIKRMHLYIIENIDVVSEELGNVI